MKPKKAEETLYLDEGCEPWATKYRVSLGPDQYPPPSPPTWREYLKPRGYTFNSQSDYERAYSEMWLMPDDVDKPLDGVSWENVWEFTESPQAKAHQLLADLNLDCDPKEPAPQGWPHALHSAARLDRHGEVHFTPMKLLEKSPARIANQRHSDPWPDLRETF